jgi:hypothetical protein
MAIKSPDKLRQELRELEHDRDALQSEVDNLDPDSQTALLIKGKVSELNDAIYAIQAQLSKAASAEEKIAKKATWEKLAPHVDRAMRENYMGYVIPEAKFIYCKNYGVNQSNVQFSLVPATQIVRVLNKMIGTTIRGKEYQEIIDYFETKNRSYFTVTSSFNTSKWDEQQIYNKMTIARDQWLKPDYEHSDAYDPRIDFLIHSVAGGKQENIDHLEQWVAFKYLNPNKSANIPNLDMGGTPGGNGKGRFIELLKTIFTPICVIQAHKEELEKFNSQWEMAVILYYDEPEEKELAASKLKQATGSEDMRVEKKGIDATMADRNYNFIFMSNNENGVVKLSGGSDGGEDRRYSVLTTDVVLYEALVGASLTDIDARSYLNELAQQVIKDPVTVSRWLAHVIKKHNVTEMQELPALHGHDYQARFENQKDAVTEAFDAILPVFIKNKCIPIYLLTNLVQTLTENQAHKTRNVVSKFMAYLARNKVTAIERKKQLIGVKWQDTNMEDYQIDSIVIPQQARTKYEFTYSDVSQQRWINKLGVKNLVDADTVKL